MYLDDKGDEFDMVRTFVNLNTNKILPGKETTFKKAIDCVYRKKNEHSSTNFVRMELLYEDIERNLYAHSIIINIREYADCFYLVTWYEGIFVKYREKRRQIEEESFYYGDAEKLFSEQHLFYKTD